ncbi:MAG TPA: helix-turn-helix domain-containing protein [Streptomyces sp.]
MNSADEQPRVTVAALARELGVSRATIYRAVWSGALPADRTGVGRGSIEISPEARAEFMRHWRRPAATP